MMKGHPSGNGIKPVNFNEAPFLAIWETSRSCGLACKHCRAEAILRRDPRELSTEEGKRVMSETAAMGTPIFILSGGDPLNRQDLEELIAHGKSAGLRVGTIPAATENLTQKRIDQIKNAGIDQIAFSLDGPTAALHDSFRGVAGSFAKTMQGIAYAHNSGVPLQINTCFASWNFQYLEEMVTLIRSLKVVFWEVFFLIPIGRGGNMESITAEQFEVVFDRMRRLNSEDSFIVKLTEAQHYRRFVTQKETEGAASPSGAGERIKHIVARPRGVNGSMGMSPQAVNAGKGFMFIDHIGNICPSGFLPIPAGNVRQDSLASVYRDSALFKELRDPRKLKGKCGVCEYAGICGGSRSRAHAATGDYLESDPYCLYTPVAALAR